MFLQTVVLVKTLERPLDSKEMKPVNAKGNHPWVFTGRVDAEAPILWPPDAKNWLTRKDLDAGKNWRQEKGVTEDEMVGWHRWLNGHEFEEALGDGEGQGGLTCCSPWGYKELDMTKLLNNNNPCIGSMYTDHQGSPITDFLIINSFNNHFIKNLYGCES